MKIFLFIAATQTLTISPCFINHNIMKLIYHEEKFDAQKKKAFKLNILIIFEIIIDTKILINHHGLIREKCKNYLA